MSGTGNVIFKYDGSFEGLLCCVFESVYRRIIPIDIIIADACQTSLYDEIYIETDVDKAQRVYDSIEKKINNQAKNLVKQAFLTCLEGKEMEILRFLYLGYKHGSRVTLMLAAEPVNALLQAVKSMNNEKHLLLGFIRFTDYSGVLVAEISPKNFVLPLLRSHFEIRYPNEAFMIYDKTNKYALVHQGGKSKIVEIENLQLPQQSENEELYKQMWQKFYKTIAIKARENPKCRMTHMPKRYWQNMCELGDEAGMRIGEARQKKLDNEYLNRNKVSVN